MAFYEPGIIVEDVRDSEALARWNGLETQRPDDWDTYEYGTQDVALITGLSIDRVWQYAKNPKNNISRRGKFFILKDSDIVSFLQRMGKVGAHIPNSK